ncbi:MAG: hypothetical protein J5I59_02875, partial [Saprospiraceae bacterium]|nr:hypothetical protein [Saprospiraceae bacterium]
LTSVFTPQWRQYAKSKHYLSYIPIVQRTFYVLPQRIHNIIKNLRCLEKIVAGKPFHDADIRLILLGTPYLYTLIPFIDFIFLQANNLTN